MKVFAIGGVIAEQLYTVQTAWIAADPVTGSSLRIYKTGMFFEDERKGECKINCVTVQ